MTSKCQWVGFKRRCLPTSCRDCKDTSIDSLHHFLFILHCKNICNFHGITKFVSKELSSTKVKSNFYIFKTKREFSMWSLFCRTLRWLPIGVNWSLACPVNAVVPCLRSSCTLCKPKMLPTRMFPTIKPCPAKCCPHENGLSPPLSPPPRIGSPGKVHVSLFQAPVGKGSKTKSLR